MTAKTRRALEMINLLHDEAGISVAFIASIVKYDPKSIRDLINKQSCNKFQEKKMVPRILKRWDNLNAQIMTIAAKQSND